MSSGARWLADERQGRHDDLGERQPAPDASLMQSGGDPTIAAPPVCYPLIERLDADSWREWLWICMDAGLVRTPVKH